MKIRWKHDNKWNQFTDRELDLISRQNATAVMLMLSSFAPVVIEKDGRYIAHKDMAKQLDGPCASFDSVIKKLSPTMLFKELM